MQLQNAKKPEESSVTFEEALEAAGNGKFQYMVVIIGGLILLCSYVSVGAVAFVLPAAQCDLDMDSEAKGRLASVGYVGLILSCHFWGFLSDTLGRRYILIRCLLVDGLLYFVTSVTPYFPVILVLRLFNGFVSSGGVASIYAYIGEFHSDKNRTKALMTASMVASFAYFLMPIYAWLTIPGEWALDLFPSLTYKPWRLFYAGCGVPSIICAFLIYFLPESPKFLLAKGKVNEAVATLKHINDINKGSTKVEYSVSNIKINETEKVAKLGSDRNKAIAFLQLMWNQTVPLFKVPHRLNIALVCLTQYLIYFSNGGMYLWLPETMNRLAIFKTETNDNSATFCDVVEYKRKFSLVLTNTTETKGVPTILKYSDMSYNRQAINNNNDNTSEIKCSEHVDFTVYYYLAILGVIQSINLGVIATLSRLANKKYLLTGLTFGALVSSIAIQEIRITEYAAYDACLLIIFTGAVIPIINSVVVELFPTNLRGMAGCLTLMSCRLGTVTTNIIAGMLIDENCNKFIWCFVVAMIVCLITVLLLPTKASKVLPEDKNNTTRV